MHTTTAAPAATDRVIIASRSIRRRPDQAEAKVDPRRVEDEPPSAAHIADGGDLDQALFKRLGDAVEAHQVVQRVVQRAQIGVDFLGQVAGQEAQAFAGLHRRAHQHDALHGVALQRVDRAGDREIRLAGARGTDAESDVVTLDVAQVLAIRFAARQKLEGRPEDRAAVERYLRSQEVPIPDAKPR